jgi:hypothetical protein
LTPKSVEQTLKEAILTAVSEQKPETVDRLTHQVHDEFPSTSEREILDLIIILQNEGKLHFTQRNSLPGSPGTYLRSSHASWYWATFAVTLAAAVSVFTIPEDAPPFVIIRYVLGAIFILWLPGYAFIKALFPIVLPFKTSNRDLDTVERVVLSLGMSLALVPIVGLLLNYTPWGIRLTPMTFSLTALTLTFATVAVMREYQSSKELGAQATKIGQI